MKYFISEQFGTVFFVQGNDMFGIPIGSDNVLDDDGIFTVTDIEEEDVKEMDRIKEILIENEGE